MLNEAVMHSFLLLYSINFFALKYQDTIIDFIAFKYQDAIFDFISYQWYTFEPIPLFAIATKLQTFLDTSPNTLVKFLYSAYSGVD